MFGSSTPAPIWQEFMNIVVGNLPVEDFPEDPPGTSVYYATPRVTIPEVAGLDYELAQRLLLQAGLDVDIKLVNSDEAEDLVIGTDPIAGARVLQGSLVEIEVSNGLSPTGSMPDLIGLRRNQANNTLQNLSEAIQLPFVWVFDDEAPTTDQGLHNTVAFTEPSAGRQINENTVIHITLYAYTP
ncbi:MAG: hypothetical protein A2146_07565 [Actinobacteria bacterium RBG_16_67_10]|nr:MAG: hypothetical protein A2146_07565 [Actinobacteria bacterium RBG_16_67_10]